MVENKIQLTGFDELERALTEIIQLIKNPSEVFGEAKLIMFQDVMDHFKKEEGPDEKWAPLSKFTLAQRRKHGRGAKILQNTGKGINSVTAIHSKAGAEVGTNVDYMAKHQLGGSGTFEAGIPQRQFLWISERAKQRIADRFILALKQAGR